MKLAIVRQRYTPFGGAERFVERALSSLRERGTDVTVIARSWAGNQPAGDGFLRCDPFYIGRTWRDASFARAVRRIIAAGRFDLVQSHERIAGCHIYRAGDGVHATWLELRARARGGINVDALSPWHRYTLAAERALFADPALKAVICNSRMVQQDIARRFGLPESKLPLIANGVDLNRYHPALRDQHRAALRQQWGIGPETPVILFVGSGFERKGVAVLLQALSVMGRRDGWLLVVGKDKAQAQMMEQAKRLGLAERVRFVGPQQDVAPWYGAADVFCLPTLYDPFPNAALEALACGLPVVTSTTSGTAEIVAAAGCGGVCDALDAQALAALLDQALEPATGRAMGQAARAAAENHGLEAMAARLADLYQRL